MTVLMLSHGHLMRLSVRRRAGSNGRGQTHYLVYHVKKACQECRALGRKLVRSSREYRARILAQLIDGHRPKAPARRRAGRR
jgi:hypothetical protein